MRFTRVMGSANVTPMPKSRLPDELVYFAQTQEGRVKIGCSRCVSQRCAALGRGTILLGLLRGGRVLESEIHRRFAHARIAGEWFDATPRLLAWVRENTTRKIPKAHRSPRSGILIRDPDIEMALNRLGGGTTPPITKTRLAHMILEAAVSLCESEGDATAWRRRLDPAGAGT